MWDIDGTVTEKSERSPFDFEIVGEDKVIVPIKNMFDIVNCGNKDIINIFATGRSESCRDETSKWLKDNGFNYNKLLMRPKHDFRLDWKIKKEMAIEITKENNIITWFDEKSQVTDYLRRIGIKVLNVDYANFLTSIYYLNILCSF